MEQIIKKVRELYNMSLQDRTLITPNDLKDLLNCLEMIKMKGNKNDK